MVPTVWMRTAALLVAASSIVGAAQASTIVVSDSGQATFSLPIVPSPGRAGMEPRLSLVYSSSGSNGPVGLGWSVQGLSQIIRCQAINAVDGRRTVAYEQIDKLCLDGQRLIISQAPSVGDPGTATVVQAYDASPVASSREFRLENDNFSRVVAKGAGTEAPLYFKVWSKSGLLTEYGATDAGGTVTVVQGASDSRVTTVGHTNPSRNGITSAWLVKRITDTLGNFIEFDYVQAEVAIGSGAAGLPKLGREWHLSKVRYTGSKTDPSTVNEIAFVYNGDIVSPDPFDVYPRADSSEAFQAGSKVVQSRLLRKVQVKNSNSVVREYRIVHRASQSSGLPLVAELKECNAAGVCLPPTKFEYRDSQVSSTLQRVINASLTAAELNATDAGLIIGDFNGDGRADVLRWRDDPASNKLYIASDRSAGLLQQKPSGFELVQPGDKLGGTGIKTHVVDVNGDTLPDLVRTCQSQSTCPYLTVWLSRGDGTFKKMASAEPSFSLYSSNGTTQTTCGFDANGVRIWRSSYSSHTVYFRDIDGDAFVDILAVDQSGGTDCAGEPTASTSTGTYLKGNGNGSFSAPTTPLSNSNWAAWGRPTFDSVARGTEHAVVSDINRDGLPDMLSGALQLNQGGVGFVSTSTSAYKNVRVFIDVNGDGLPDVVGSNDNDTVKDADPALWINQGDGTFIQDNRGLALIKNDTSFRLGSGTIGSMPMDVNADGLSDFVAWDNQGNPTVWFARRAPTGVVSFVKDTSGTARGLPNMFSKFFVGDFTGTGDSSLLAVVGSGTYPYLYTTDVARAPDLMSAVISAAGLRTEVSYQALSQSAATPVYTVGREVMSDPETFVPSTMPVAVAPAQWVVASTKQPSGVAAASGGASASPVVESVFLYQGMKAAFGRGNLGFSIVTKFYPYANGDLMVTTTSYHQDPAQFQYLGQPVYSATFTGQAMYTQVELIRRSICSLSYKNLDCDEAATTPTYVTGPFNPVMSMSGLKLVSRTDYAYCDLTVSLTTAGGLVPPAAGTTYGSPCAATTRIRRPYQAQSVERHYDLAGSSQTLVIEKITTNLEMTAFGEPILSQLVTTAPLVAGVAGWASTRTTNNTYGANNIADGKWYLGRVTQSTVTSALIAPQPSKTAGAEPRATDVSGGAVTPPPMAPGALAAILQLLLED